MATVKLEVFKFEDLPEKAQRKILDEYREMYFNDFMLSDVVDALIYYEDSPIKNSAINVNNFCKDISYDLSNYIYDHFVFTNPEINKDKILQDSGAMELLKAAADGSFTACIMDGDLIPFIDNLRITWNVSDRELFNHSGYTTVELLDDNDGIYDNEAIESLLESIGKKIDEYMHDLQQRTYKFAIKIVDDASSDASLKEWIIEDDNYYNISGSLTFDNSSIEE